MALNASKIPYSGGKNFKRAPALAAGTYPGRLVQIIDMGLQPQQPWQGEEKPPKSELYTTYECLDEFLLDEEGNEDETKPRWISETLPMNPLDSDLAKSTKRYLALDPLQELGGDWAQLSGAPAMITVSANPNKKGVKDDEGNLVVYNNISSVQTMREKDAKKAADLVNPPKVFDMDEPDMDVFLSLPDWMRQKMKENLNYEGSLLEKALEDLDEAGEVKKRRDRHNEDKPKASKEKAVKEETPEEEGDEGW